MTSHPRLAELVAELRAALLPPGAFGPHRFIEATRLQTLPWLLDVEPQERPAYLAERVRAAINGLDEDADRLILRLAFGIDDDPEEPCRNEGLGKRLHSAARRIPMNADHVRQELLPAALSEVAFALSIGPAFSALGKLYPLGFRVLQVSVTDVFDEDDPDIRTSVCRLRLELTRDKVNVLPRLWIPHVNWESMEQPRATSNGHEYIGKVRVPSVNDARARLDFFFLGTDNRIGDEVAIEYHRKGRLPLDTAGRVRCFAADNPEQLEIGLDNLPPQIQSYRSAVYADAGMVAPIEASRWNPVTDRTVAVSWRGSITSSCTYALEWR